MNGKTPVAGVMQGDASAQTKPAGALLPVGIGALMGACTGRSLDQGPCYWKKQRDLAAVGIFACAGAAEPAVPFVFPVKGDVHAAPSQSMLQGAQQDSGHFIEYFCSACFACCALVMCIASQGRAGGRGGRLRHRLSDDAFSCRFF